MIPLNEDFGIHKLKQQCDNSITRIYGFIMYTRSHSYIVKVLRDNDFSNELNEISGANWPIFSVKPLLEEKHEAPCSSIDENVIQMMKPTWNEPNQNRKLLDFFNLKESQHLPCFITFIWNDKQELEQITWPLKNTSKQDAFNSIREIVTIISQREFGILPQYKSSESVFREVKGSIQGVIERRKIIIIAERFLRIKELLIGLK